MSSDDDNADADDIKALYEPQKSLCFFRNVLFFLEMQCTNLDFNTNGRSVRTVIRQALVTFYISNKT